MSCDVIYGIIKQVQVCKQTYSIVLFPVSIQHFCEVRYKPEIQKISSVTRQNTSGSTMQRSGIGSHPFYIILYNNYYLAPARHQ